MVSKILQCCLLKDSVFRELKQQWRRRLRKHHLKSEVALPQTLSRCRPCRRCLSSLLLFDVMWPSLRVQPSFLSPFHLGCFTERTSVPQWQCYTDNVNQCVDNLVIIGFQININFFEFMFLVCYLRVRVPLWKSGSKTQENNKFHKKIVDCFAVDL